MSDMVIGKDLRNAIKGRGLTMQQAADQLDISRQGLYDIFKKSELSDEDLQNVKSKLGIDFTNKEDRSDKYTASLEQINDMLLENNSKLTESVKLLEEQLKQQKRYLKRLVEGQQVFSAAHKRVHDVLLQDLAVRHGISYEKLLQTVYNTESANILTLKEGGRTNGHDTSGNL